MKHGPIEGHVKLPLRRVYRARLFDVSAVTFAAYAEASVDARDQDAQWMQWRRQAASALAARKSWTL
jgi:phage head maturation protease